MPFLAAGALIGGLGAGAVAGGMTAVGGAALGASIGSMVQGQSDAKKAASAARNAAANAQIDIAALDAQTRAIAKKNAEDSAALEKQLTPEVPKLRTAANEAVLGGIGGSDEQRQLANFLMSRFGQPSTSAQFNTTGFNRTESPAFGQAPGLTKTDSLADPSLSAPLLADAIAKARADLALGGKLSLDQRNEATRRGAAQSGSVSGNLGLGRDLTARDLGLTSYGVEQQRLANAAGLSPVELSRETSLQQLIQNAAAFNLNKNLGESNFGLNRFNSESANALAAANFGLNQNMAEANFGLNQNSAAANFGLNRDQMNQQGLFNQFSLLNSYYNNLRQQDLAAAGYGQSIQQPTVGLDPSAVANLAVGNQNVATQGAMNAANIKAQGAQNLTNFGGQLLGYGFMNGFGGSGGTGMDPASSYLNWGRG
jgi:hypothetical protein